MHHHHHHNSSETGDISVRKRLLGAFFLNLFFTIIEFIGGAITNSMAIYSDAIHDLGDTIAIGSSLWLEKVSERKRDEKYSYGYRRFSTLGALITSVILFAGSIIIIVQSIPRFLEPQEVMAKGMIYMSILGIIFNGLAFFRLMGGGKSLNNRAVMLHLLEDVLGWVAVLIGSIIIKYTGWYIIDPILSLGVATYILYNVIGNLKDIIKVFLQSVPDDFNIDEFEEKVLAIEGVKEIHDVHTWSMDGDFHVLSVHLVISDTLAKDDIIRIRQKATQTIIDLGIQHPTVALEFESEACIICD